jgi:hypothetical protein
MTYTDINGREHTISQEELRAIAMDCGTGRQSYLEYARERWQAPTQVPASPLMERRPGQVPIGMRPSERGAVRLVVQARRNTSHPVTDVERNYIMRHPTLRHVTLGHILGRTADTIRRHRHIMGVVYRRMWRFSETPEEVSQAILEWDTIIATLVRR